MSLDTVPHGALFLAALFSPTWLAERMLVWIPIVLSLSVHEWAHAWTAYQLGDDTAEKQGRMTLNPLEHIDPIGTVALPLLGVPFGWAKPVPVNPNRFEQGVNMRLGMVLTAVAGPLSNLVLAGLCSAALVLLPDSGPRWLTALVRLLEMGVFLNLALAVFNLLPIYPLDGSRVLDGLSGRGGQISGWLRRRGGVAIAIVLILLLLLRPGWIQAVVDWVAGWTG